MAKHRKKESKEIAMNEIAESEVAIEQKKEALPCLSDKQPCPRCADASGNYKIYKTQNNSRSLITENGKVFVGSVIRYCECLSCGKRFVRRSKD